MPSAESPQPPAPARGGPCGEERTVGDHDDVKSHRGSHAEQRAGRVSRPGRRTYVNAQEIPKVLGGMGTTIVSTSRGVMTGHDARRAGVGGEVVAYVW